MSAPYPTARALVRLRTQSRQRDRLRSDRSLVTMDDRPTRDPAPMIARAVCSKCARPASVCWCAHLPSIDTRTPILVLQHPREERVAIGTARMASLCLPNAKLVVGVHLDDDPNVVAALGDPARPAVLLWPGPDALDLAVAPPPGPVTLVVVDGTWSLAKKLVRVNPRIAALPRYALTPSEPSQYRIRREPRAECLSTIEAIHEALGTLEGDVSRFRPMLAPFRAMIDAQIDHEERVHGHRHRRVRRTESPRLPAALTDGRRVVLVGGEAERVAFQTPLRPHRPPLSRRAHSLARDHQRRRAIRHPRRPFPSSLSFDPRSHGALADRHPRRPARGPLPRSVEPIHPP